MSGSAGRGVQIFYLTGTGNSLKLAGDIGNRLGKHELISISSSLQAADKTVVDGDIAGFVFPVYFARLPAVMHDFIKKTEFRSISYTFAVANGGGLFGRALHEFENLLQSRGRSLQAGFRIGMPGNHPRLAVISRKNPEEYFHAAGKKVDEIEKTVRGKHLRHKELRSGSLGKALSFVLGYDIPYEYSLERRLDDFFWLNENCTNCGDCIRICPVGNIVQTRRRPVWQNRCINCFACYNLCTWRAIQIRCPWKIFPLESDLVQLPRYCHPDADFLSSANMQADP